MTKKKLTAAEIRVITDEVVNRVRENKTGKVLSTLKTTSDYRQYEKLAAERNALEKQINALNKKMNAINEKLGSKYKIGIGVERDTSDVIVSYWGYDLQYEQVYRRLALENIGGGDVKAMIECLVTEFSK